MKTKLFIFLAIFLSAELHAQEIEDNVSFDPKDTIYLPHFGQNVILCALLSDKKIENYYNYVISCKINRFLK